MQLLSEPKIDFIWHIIVKWILFPQSTDHLVTVDGFKPPNQLLLDKDHFLAHVLCDFLIDTKRWNVELLNFIIQKGGDI